LIITALNLDLIDGEDFVKKITKIHSLRAQYSINSEISIKNKLEEMESDYANDDAYNIKKSVTMKRIRGLSIWETSSKSFYKCGKKYKSSKLGNLKDNTNPSSKPIDIVKKFYGNLYTKRRCNKESRRKLLRNIKKVNITTKEFTKLNKKLTVKRIEKSIKRTKSQ